MACIKTVTAKRLSDGAIVEVSEYDWLSLKSTGDYQYISVKNNCPQTQTASKSTTKTAPKKGCGCGRK
jgi:hypothetical protein